MISHFLCWVCFAVQLYITSRKELCNLMSKIHQQLPSKLCNYQYKAVSIVFYQLSFEYTFCHFQKSINSKTCMFLCFSFKIYLNFHLAYYDNRGQLVTEWEKVYRNYLTKWFIFDFFASFPYDIFALCFPSQTQLRMLTYIELIHCVRVVKIFAYYREWLLKLNIR